MVSPRIHLPSRRSARQKLPSTKAAINITIEEMSEIKATLSRFEAQKEQATTQKGSLNEYNNLIRTRHDLTLSCHAFFTANNVLDPVIGATLEYS